MRAQGPPPQGQSNGIIQTFSYDDAIRLKQVTTVNTGAYVHYDYGAFWTSSFASVNSVAANYWESDSYTNQFFDGLGRAFAVSSNHPGSQGGNKGQLTIYDTMGRVVQQTNPFEIDSGWHPTGDDQSGYQFNVANTFDWKGRPLRIYHMDGTYKEASYAGCGCAGGEVVTLTDEVGRQQKVYSDVLGRQWKTEMLNTDSSVYATTTSRYNALDQVSRVRQYTGAAPFPEPEIEGSGYQTTSMNYDGYGRLASKHVPEQQDTNGSPTYTNFSYWEDDTVHTMTDARGAVSTYLYNGRHQVTSATSALSGQTTISRSFEYDAAGNRKKMTDGLGQVDYVYDSLSRMSSETRTFSDPNNSSINNVARTISYGYNMANQLTSVTDPFSAQVSYNRDSAGRVSSVTGLTFASISTYASNIQYRAWGAAKHLTYGNNLTMDAVYNSRMQATSFMIPNVINKTYQYNADGALSYSHDLIDQRFDRAYAYDTTTAQVRQALSGAEARNQGTTNDRPYKETFDYDPFGHLTTQNTNHWTAFYSAGGSYTNNRRTGWFYDLDGRITMSSDLNYTYDAAGQMATAYADTSTTQSFDGDGQRIKTVEVDGSTTTTMYYVHSTVLGGKVLTELNDSGGKKRTFVYSGSQVLATQEVIPFYNTESLTWEHRDPSNASVRNSISNGSVVGANELDLFGSDSGTANIYLNDPNPPDENQSLLPYPSFGDPRHPGTTYNVDGVKVPAEFFMMMLDTVTHGSGGLGLAAMTARESTRIVGYRNSGVRWGTPFEATYDANGRMTGVNWGDFDPEMADVNYGSESAIYNNGWSDFASLLPQKPIPQPAPTPPGLPPHKDPEQPCIDRTNDVRRDIRAIARIVHGTTFDFPPMNHRFPGTDIDPRGQSFGTAIRRLTSNGFTLDAILGYQPLTHTEGENYQKLFSDGLYYHVIVKYPGGYERPYFGSANVNPRLQTPRITVHCHATDPSGSDHFWDTLFP